MVQDVVAPYNFFCEKLCLYLVFCDEIRCEEIFFCSRFQTASPSSSASRAQALNRVVLGSSPRWVFHLLRFFTTPWSQ
jgi:hypothetical protein